MMSKILIFLKGINDKINAYLEGVCDSIGYYLEAIDEMNYTQRSDKSYPWEEHEEHKK